MSIQVSKIKSFNEIKTYKTYLLHNNVSCPAIFIVKALSYIYLYLYSTIIKVS